MTEYAYAKKKENFYMKTGEKKSSKISKTLFGAIEERTNVMSNTFFDLSRYDLSIIQDD